MAGFDFVGVEAWEGGGGVLPAGDHVVKIDSIVAGESSGGWPQLTIEMSNGQGSIREWMTLPQSGFGRIAQFTDALGLDRAAVQESMAAVQAPNGPAVVFSEAFVRGLVGKSVGVIVREEPDRQDPSKTRTRVKGFAPAANVAGGPSGVTRESGGHTAQAIPTDTVPF